MTDLGIESRDREHQRDVERKLNRIIALLEQLVGHTGRLRVSDAVMAEPTIVVTDVE